VPGHRVEHLTANATYVTIPRLRNVADIAAVRNTIANTDDADADKLKLHHLLRFGRIACKRILKEQDWSSLQVMPDGRLRTICHQDLAHIGSRIQEGSSIARVWSLMRA